MCDRTTRIATIGSDKLRRHRKSIRADPHVRLLPAVSAIPGGRFHSNAKPVLWPETSGRVVIAPRRPNKSSNPKRAASRPKRCRTCVLLFYEIFTASVEEEYCGIWREFYCGCL